MCRQKAAAAKKKKKNRCWCWTDVYPTWVIFGRRSRWVRPHRMWHQLVLKFAVFFLIIKWYQKTNTKAVNSTFQERNGVRVHPTATFFFFFFSISNTNLLQFEVWQRLESQVCQWNNETASSLRFNKPESANFIFDWVQYFIPKEGRSRLLHTGASVAFPPPGALGGSQQMRECRGLHAVVRYRFFFLCFPGTKENLCSSFTHSNTRVCVWWQLRATVSS